MKVLYVDSLFENAAKVVVKEQKGSISQLLRIFQIGYNRAEHIMDDLEKAGIVSRTYDSKPRDVLIQNEEQLDAFLSTFNYKMVPEYIRQTSIQGINRLRMGTDGDGITTLVAFHGCPLCCRYCLNPSCISDIDGGRLMLPEDVMNELKRDELYFIATKGGVTFGGGEPLTNSLYIRDILELGAKEWNVTVETSLNFHKRHLQLLLPYINEYIVDIKDMNPTIYHNYTGAFNKLVKDNLKWLIDNGMAERIVCRIPLIPDFNNESDRQKSKKELSEMGIFRFDLLTYSLNKTMIE